MSRRDDFHPHIAKIWFAAIVGSWSLVFAIAHIAIGIFQ
jgi:hypothetical protein